MSGTGIDGYRAFLQRRDGEADLLNRRLAIREEFFDGLEADPVRSARRIDRDALCGTCAAVGPSRAWTGKCCSSWRPLN